MATLRYLRLRQAHLQLRSVEKSLTILSPHLQASLAVTFEMSICTTQQSFVSRISILAPAPKLRKSSQGHVLVSTPAESTQPTLHGDLLVYLLLLNGRPWETDVAPAPSLQ